jgi:hypothetical protein
MSVKERLQRDEAELRSIIERLGAAGDDTGDRGDRAGALRQLSAKLAETRGFVDEVLGGRSDHERAVLLYKIRVEFPLYSHLDALASLSGEFVDWSTRDFSLTAASPR